MRIIKEASSDVFKAWGEGKISETEYRLIKYNLRKDVDEGTLLCNTVTGELILLDEDEKALLEKLPTKYDAKLDELIKRRFLVPADYDEHSAVLKLRKILQLLNRKKEITIYTILPTTCCNARCFYCYEANYKHISMSEQTADDVVEFIKDHHGDKKVGIGWFGGEPTLGEARIDQICKGLQAENIEYSSSMISNGYLFDEEMAKKAKGLWKLTNIQITLDGTEEIYNKVKAYVGIKDSAYKRVIRNIGLILDQDIRVSVRMNLDRHNADDLKNLIEELAITFKGRENFSAYVWPLFDDCGYKPVQHEEADRLWLVAKQNELNNIIIANKFYSKRKNSLPVLSTNHCMADDDSTLIINPDGTFAKCEHLCEENVGNVKDGITDNKKIAYWKIPSEHPKCAGCKIFPACVEIENCFATKKCYKDTREAKINAFADALIEIFNKEKNK